MRSERPLATVQGALIAGDHKSRKMPLATIVSSALRQCDCQSTFFIFSPLLEALEASGSEPLQPPSHEGKHATNIALLSFYFVFTVDTKTKCNKKIELFRDFYHGKPNWYTIDENTKLSIQVDYAFILDYFISQKF